MAKLVIYYDGRCQLCSREMRHFHGIPGATDRIEFVDYTAIDFDSAAAGLDRRVLDRRMHVRLPDGSVRVGIDAAIAFWEAAPGWKWLSGLASRRLLYPLFWLGYECFARVRPWLPKRKQSCIVQPPNPTAAGKV